MISDFRVSIDKQIDVLNGVDFANYRNEALALNGENPRYVVDNNQVFVISDNVIASEPSNTLS